jgi:hypothetical protein
MLVQGAINAYNSNFFGKLVYGATGAYGSNFRSNAGLFATGAFFKCLDNLFDNLRQMLMSNFMGNQAGYQATSANNSNLWYWCWSSGIRAFKFFGYNVGGGATFANRSNSLVKMLVM